MADRQVSGTDITLLEAIETDVVPRPDLMDWNAWQRWRRVAGQRPTAADGAALDNRGEVALWRGVMTSLYGADWLEEVYSPRPDTQLCEPRPAGPDASAVADGTEAAAAPTIAPEERASPGSG